MKTRYLLYATGSLLLAALPARAGSRTGASGAITIPADTVDAGGGKSTSGTGATAITVTASMGGIGGTVSAGTTANQQGYIPQILPAPTPPLSGYDLWASTNIPAGKDASFGGDWNGDGVLNAVAYVFGNTRIEPAGGQPEGTGKIPAPPSIPADVNVYLDWSSALTDWLQIVRWENGNAPVFQFPAATSITGGYIVDTGGLSTFFYRYRITRR